MVKKPRIEIYSEAKTKGKPELGFRVRSKNGRTVTASTGYNTFQGAQKSIAALAEIMKSNPQVVDLREILKRGKKAAPKAAAKPAPKKVKKVAKKTKPKPKAVVSKKVTRNGHTKASGLLRATRTLATANRRTKLTNGRKTTTKSALGVAA